LSLNISETVRDRHLVVEAKLLQNHDLDNLYQGQGHWRGVT